MKYKKQWVHGLHTDVSGSVMLLFDIPERRVRDAASSQSWKPRKTKHGREWKAEKKKTKKKKEKKKKIKDKRKKKKDRLHDELQQHQQQHQQLNSKRTKLKRRNRSKREADNKYQERERHRERERDSKWEGGGRIKRKMKDVESIGSYRQTNMLSRNIHLFKESMKKSMFSKHPMIWSSEVITEYFNPEIFKKDRLPSVLKFEFKLKMLSN